MGLGECMNDEVQGMRIEVGPVISPGNTTGRRTTGVSIRVQWIRQGKL
jgi:hypothetical protein